MRDDKRNDDENDNVVGNDTPVKNMGLKDDDDDDDDDDDKDDNDDVPAAENDNYKDDTPAAGISGSPAA